MSEIAICVEHLGKQYRIGISQRRHDTLRDAISDFGLRISDFRKGYSNRNGHNQKSKIEQQKPDETIWALRDVSFEVRRGEVIGIIGRNGAGKSTLLKILSRITEPTTGTADIHGRVGSLLEVGTGFHPELTGRENIFLNGAILGMRRKEVEKKFEEIVAFAEVEKFIDTAVKRYSSGMYVRLAFAVAAFMEPEILLVDEVLAVGDSAFQKKCLGKIEDITEGGRTVLFVSHNMGAIESLCSQVLWIDAGMIREQADATKVISSYLLDSASRGFSITQSHTARTNEKFLIERVIFKGENGIAKTIFRPGEEITIEVQYYASQDIERPHLWIGISSQYGPLFGADMTVDGHCPTLVRKGYGKIECVLKPPVLAPQTFTARMGARGKDAMTFLTKTIEVGAFRVVATAADYNLFGPQADVSLIDGSPIAVPYEWRLPDGQMIRVEPHRDSAQMEHLSVTV